MFCVYLACCVCGLFVFVFVCVVFVLCVYI